MARVLWIGTFDPDFSRNRKLARLLEIGGHEVEVVQRTVWDGDRVEIPTGGKVGLAWRAATAYVSLSVGLLRARRPDVVLVSYPGWFDAIVLGNLARIRRVPVLLDVFISVHDTVVSDRRLIRSGSRMAGVLALVDRWALRSATRSIADTPAHAAFFAELGHVPADRIDVVWLGADDAVFTPRPEIEPESDLVLFHGTFIALQGIETIVRAAKLLEPDGVRVRLIGAGQEDAAIDRLVDELEPTNVERVGKVPLADVPGQIAAATLCLGIFGTSAKAGRVIPNKVYECLAVGRPVLTASTPAIEATFDGEVATSPAGDAESLATSVRRLLADDDLRERLGRDGHRRYESDFCETALAGLFDDVLSAASRQR